jgi:hypothetical protein
VSQYIGVVESLARTMFRRMKMVGPVFTAFKFRRSPVSRTISRLSKPYNLSLRDTQVFFSSCPPRPSSSVLPFGVKFDAVDVCPSSTLKS